MSTRNMLIMAPAQAAQVLVGIGSVVIFTRLMSAEDYGRYALILSTAMLAHTIALTWAEAAAFRFVLQAEREGRSKSHFATLCAIGVASCVLCAVIAAGALAFMPQSGWTAAAIGFAATLSGLRFITKVARETNRAEQNMLHYALAETAFVAGGFAVAIALLVWTPSGPAAPFIGACVAGAVVVAFDAPGLLARARGGFVQMADVQRYALYGAPLAASLAVDLVMQTGTRAVLAWHVGEAGAGAFAAASGAIGRALDVLFVWTALAFSPALLSAFESGDQAATQQAGQALMKALCFVCAPATIGLCLVATPLCALMIGEDLATQASALAPFVAMQGFAAGLISYLVTEAFVLRRKTGLRLALLVPIALLHLGLLLVLVPMLGLIGAGWASLTSAVIGIVVLGAFGQKLLPFPWPLPELLKIAVACTVMTIGVTLTPASEGLLALVSKASVGLALYTFTAIALDVFGMRAWLGGRLRGAPA
jgi:O-antigen/teichoic acid export membrane protein